MTKKPKFNVGDRVKVLGGDMAGRIGIINVAFLPFSVVSEEWSYSVKFPKIITLYIIPETSLKRHVEPLDKNWQNTFKEL